MLRQLAGDTETTGLGKFSNQSPRYRDITSRKLASADHPRFGRLRPSALHSTPTLTQLEKQRKQKSVAVVLGLDGPLQKSVQLVFPILVNPLVKHLKSELVTVKALAELLPRHLPANLFKIIRDLPLVLVELGLGVPFEQRPLHWRVIVVDKPPGRAQFDV